MTFRVISGVVSLLTTQLCSSVLLLSLVCFCSLEVSLDDFGNLTVDLHDVVDEQLDNQMLVLLVLLHHLLERHAGVGLSGLLGVNFSLDLRTTKP